MITDDIDRIWHQMYNLIHETPDLNRFTIWRLQAFSIQLTPLDTDYSEHLYHIDLISMGLYWHKKPCS